MQETREGSAFFKHIEDKHKKGEKFEDYIHLLIIKSYNKTMTRNIEEGTFIINYQGKILNSKNKWHLPKMIRTTVVQGEAKMIGG